MKARFAPYLFAMLALLWSACNSRTPQPEVTEPSDGTTDRYISLTREQIASSGYKLGQLTRQVFENTVTATGSIDVPPRSKASVSAYFGGYVKQLDLLEGQRINRGETLFTLEKPEFIDIQKAFLETKEKLHFLEKDLTRQQNLAQANATSQKKLAKAEETYRIMLADHAALYRKLQMMHIDPDALTAEDLRQTVAIPCPISGHVSAIHTTPGSYLTPDAVAVEVIDPEHLHLELNVFEQDAPHIKEGQVIHFTVQGDTRSRNATVHLTRHILTPDQRTLSVHGHIDENDEEGLFVGAYVEALIVAGTDTFPALPSEAIVEADGTKFVLKVHSDTANHIRFEQVKVTEGPSYNGFTAILNHEQFSANDRFLVKGAFDLIGTGSD